MGISMKAIEVMDSYGFFGAGCKFLDFGSSNLYSASASDIKTFVRRKNPNPREDLDEWAQQLSIGSGTNGDGQALNQAFVGNLLEAAGMEYDAIDISAGYKTTIVDLNTMRLPEHMVSAYDTVVNCGTSEHILNQMNVFSAIHSATKPGGLIMHVVPSVGFVNHGYYCYTGRFFFDLAAYNQYDIIDMWYDVLDVHDNVFAGVRQYQTHFPSLSKRLEKIGTSERETALDRISIPMIALNIIYRKQRDLPFMGTVETSTSVGSISADVLSSYAQKQPRRKRFWQRRFGR